MSEQSTGRRLRLHALFEKGELRWPKVGAALAWAGVSAIVFVSAGPTAGLATAVGAALLIWLISRAL